MNIREEIQNKVADHILNVDRDQIVFVSIRLGKTRIALKAIEEGESVLVVYPIKDIKKSWEDELKKFTPKSTNITFVTKNSVHKYANTEYDVLIIDEPQLCASAKQLAAIKTIKYKKRLALAGVLSTKTIKKLNTELGLKVGFTYTVSDAIRDELVKDYQIYVHFVNMDNTKMIPYERFKRTMYGTEKEIYNLYTEEMAAAEVNKALAAVENNWGEYHKWNNIYKYNMGLRTNFLYNSPTLFKAAQELINQYKDEKVLIYTLRTDIADQLSDVSYHSKNKEEEVLNTFKDSESGHFAAVNCIQAGVTIKNVNRVIFHSYESTTETLYQKLGRSLLWEFKGDRSQIHLVCLTGTQMESWVEQASRTLEQEKIYYVVDNQVFPKLDVIKARFPDKDLFLYEGAVVYFSHEQIDGIWKNKHYCFVDNPSKTYSLNSKKLKPL